jgi:hypothetical protein
VDELPDAPVIANQDSLVAIEPAFTTTSTGPADKFGTVAVIEVELQLVTCAAIVPNWIVPLPWVEPKFAPVTITLCPTGPELGEKELKLGSTVKVQELLSIPPAVTMMEPEPGEAADGTCALIVVLFQLVTWAVAPLKTTVPFSAAWVRPKLLPEIVTVVPEVPELTETPVIVGADTRVNGNPALVTELLMTMTFPVVAPVGTVATIEEALQEVVVAVCVLNFTVPDVPKLDP